ncbi:hypothetical protein FQA47_009344 [Oryzias melastigma]|uniref:Uncharacterized protein n=1 Tax=Oryzias melastigma TaxID=30732 RepID=A0A834F900_ORYME|nr:hypothetical protein FQA47_009344 [Oryzias melastigma]
MQISAETLHASVAISVLLSRGRSTLKTDDNSTLSFKLPFKHKYRKFSLTNLSSELQEMQVKIRLSLRTPSLSEESRFPKPPKKGGPTLDCGETRGASGPGAIHVNISCLV